MLLLQNYRNSSHSWATFFLGKIYVLILTKNGLGYILGDFFTNSSGHPGCFGIFNKLPKVNNHPIGEHWPNLVAILFNYCTQSLNLSAGPVTTPPTRGRLLNRFQVQFKFRNLKLGFSFAQHPGPDVMILKYFRRKNHRKKLAFFTQNKAKLCKNFDHNIGF
jgi:hypothetical protein